MNYFSITRFLVLSPFLLLVGCDGGGDKAPVQNKSEVSVAQFQACTQQIFVLSPLDSKKGWRASCLLQKRPKQCGSDVYALLQKNQMPGCDQSTPKWVSANVKNIIGAKFCQRPYQQGDVKGWCVPSSKPSGI